MIDPGNTLLCVFSFNMGRTLETCLRSIDKHCAGLPVAIVDDGSEDPETLRVLEARRTRLREFYINRTPKEGRRLGNLYSNIQRMCDFAAAKGFSFLFLIQDDTQFVRPMDERVRREYAGLFAHDDVLQIDPRFLRRGGEIDVLHDLNAYCFPTSDNRSSYSDVGILDLRKMGAINWRFLSSEKENKKALSALGYRRLFPFTPTMMHVPFPKVYRKGERRKNTFPLNRGAYHFHDMSRSEIEAMDQRDLSRIPYFRDYLRPKNMWLSRIQYELASDTRLFC